MLPDDCGTTLAAGSTASHYGVRDQAGYGATASIIVHRIAANQPVIDIVWGNNQSGSIGQVLSAPLVVSLVDGVGNPVSGVTVVFTLTQNNGTLTGGKRTVAQTTDNSGHASGTWTLGTRSGSGK